MKRVNYFLAMISLSFFLTRCQDQPNYDLPFDPVPPAAVLDPIVHNINGGVVITYTLPEDEKERLLGVKALYSRHDGGEILEAYASGYADYIELVGFPDTKERTVTLIAFNKSYVESEPVEIKINPLIPPHELIRNSLVVSETFGGVLAKWENPTRAEIGVTLYAQGLTDTLMYYDYTYFSRETSGNYAFRGYKDVPRNFRIEIKDRWGNTATPLANSLS